MQLTYSLLVELDLTHCLLMMARQEKEVTVRLRAFHKDVPHAYQKVTQSGNSAGGDRGRER